MSIINTKIPARWAISRNLTFTGRPVAASIKKKTRCPPSRTGMGRKLIMARLILSRAIKNNRFDIPSLAC